MAWVDDRIWCHEKFTPLTPAAFAAYIKGLAYSSGMHTRGKLIPANQRLLGATLKIRRELVDAGLWDLNGDGVTVQIHDWDEHNAKRDEKRAKERERKRRWRQNHKEGDA